MSLKEDIYYLEDNFYDDYKQLRYEEKYGVTEESAQARRNVDRWKRVQNAALYAEAAEKDIISLRNDFGVLEDEAKDLRGENYKLRGVADGWKTYTDNLEQLIKRLQDRVQQSGIKIAELLAEREEISVRLHRG